MPAIFQGRLEKTDSLLAFWRDHPKIVRDGHGAPGVPDPICFHVSSARCASGELSDNSMPLPKLTSNGSETSCPAKTWLGYRFIGKMLFVLSH